MTKPDFEKILAGAVAAGANKAEAIQYIVKGYKLLTDKNGRPVFDELKSKNSKGKK